MKVPGVSARFGTDPFIWNWAMWLVARLCPKQFLQDRSQVRLGSQLLRSFLAVFGYSSRPPTQGIVTGRRFASGCA